MHSARAATSTWSGNGTSGQWTEGLNWIAPVAPANNGTVDVVFAGNKKRTNNVDRCTPAPWADWHSMGAAVSVPHAVSAVPIPEPAGTSQSTIIRGLDASQRWGFMIRAGHEKSTWSWLSPLSNFAQTGTSRTYVRFYGWRYDQNYPQFGGSPGPAWADEKDANNNRVADPSGNTIFGRLNSAVWQMVSVNPGPDSFKQHRNVHDYSVRRGAGK